MEDQKKKDFFISYNGADKKKAEWIAWVLEEAGYTTIIQAWDFHAGNDFIYEMHDAATKAKKTIAVLSPDYFDAQYTHPEWTAAFGQDPKGKERTLIPVVVREVELAGFFKFRVHINISRVSNKEEAKVLLLEGIRGERGKPEQEPDYEDPEPVERARDEAQYRIGLVDRKLLRKHAFEYIKDTNTEGSLTYIPENFCLKNGKTHGFVISGRKQEYPQDFQYQLSDLLKKEFRSGMPETARLTASPTEMGTATQYLWQLLAEFLNCDAERSAIQRRLEECKQCHIFYRELLAKEMHIEKQGFLVEILTAWSNLGLGSHSPNHILLLVHSENVENTGWRSLFSRNSGPQWRTLFSSMLAEKNHNRSLLPELRSPNYEEDIRDWLTAHFSDQEKRDEIFSTLKKEFPKSEIPFAEFKKIVLPLIKNHRFQ